MWDCGFYGWCKIKVPQTHEALLLLRCVRHGVASGKATFSIFWYANIKSAGLLWWRERGGNLWYFIHLPINYSHHWGYKLTYKYNCRKISFTQKQGMAWRWGQITKKKEKAREWQTLNGMTDGVNITVEAHWCLLPKWEEQCDSTDVATGIAGRHSTFTGVLFSVSCFQIASKQRLLNLHRFVNLTVFRRIVFIVFLYANSLLTCKLLFKSTGLH